MYRAPPFLGPSTDRKNIPNVRNLLTNLPLVSMATTGNENQTNKNHVPTRALGTTRFMHTSIRIAGITLAPFLLAGCGMPIGIQIASLFADGISVLTTEKTLTDHGISAVAEKDCALWRGVEGKDICQEPKDEAIIVAAADPTPNSASDEAKEQTSNLDQNLDIEQNWGETARAGKQQETVAQEETTEFPAEEPAITAAAPTLSPPAASSPSTPKTTSTPATWKAVAVVEELPPPPAAPRMAQKTKKKMPNITTATPTSPATHPVSPTTRKTYFIIASYHRAADAERFSRYHAKLNAGVLEGTAKGRRVFRVAVGPVAKANFQQTRRRIKRGGISDSWKLTLKKFPIVTELAALN